MGRSSSFKDSTALVPFLRDLILELKGKVNYPKEREYTHRDEEMLQSTPWSEFFQNTYELSSTWSFTPRALELAVIEAMKQVTYLCFSIYVHYAAGPANPF